MPKIKDKDKTKEQLTNELEEMRQRISILEAMETQRKQAVEEMKRSEGTMRAVLEAAKDGIVSIDQRGTINLWNNAAQIMFGYTKDEAIGKPISTVMPERFRKGFWEGMERLRSSAGDHMSGRVYEFLGLRKDGSEFSTEISLASSKTEEGIYYTAVVRDITDRKQAMEVLRASEEFSTSLLENAPYPIHVVNPDLSIRYMNPAMEKLTGFPPTEYIGIKAPYPWWPEEKQEEYLDGFLETLEKGDLTLERLFQKKNGEPLWVKLSVAAIRKSGELEYYLSNWVDITERKRAEEALRASEENFHRSLDDSPMGISIVNADGEMVYANRALLDIYGYDSLEEYINTLSKKRYTPESYAEHRERVEKRQRGEHVPSNYEVSIVRKDGEVRHLEVFRKDVIWNSEMQFQVIYQDITERKRAEEKLRESEQYFRALFEHASDSIYVMDIKGKHIVNCNNQASIDLGYSREEILQLSASDIEGILTPEEIIATHHRLKLEESPTIQGMHRRKDGTTFPVEIRFGLLDPARPGFLIATVRDITKRKQAEEKEKQLLLELSAASRLATVGEMAAGIAHEINNPLTGVVGFSGLLLKKDLSEDIRKDVDIIREGAQRIASVTDRMLRFARQSKPRRTKLNINDIIETTVAMRAYEMKTSSIEVTTELAPGLPLTSADAGLLQQAFLNIILNAEQAMGLAHHKGNLTIKTERIDDTIRVSFKDDGPGIAKKNMEKIFNPFFTTREVGQGTGLGLSVCHGIVTQHGGRIYARSTPGKGATFFVELPIVTKGEPLTLDEPAAGEPKSTSKARILVVDDEPMVQEFVAAVLTEEGHEVDTADNGNDALERLENEEYDVILLDIKLPGMSGIEIHQQLLKRSKSLTGKVIFITGDVMGKDTMAYILSSGIPYIAKPFNAAQLVKEIGRILSPTKKPNHKNPN